MTPKCRAWDKKRNEWFRHGELHLDMNGNIYLDCMKEPCNDRFDIVWFTGLHDKNGKEIYEGDIIEYKTAYDIHRGEVRWSRTELCFKCELGCTILNGALSEFVEVIGDIHTTPDLLEGKQ